MQVQLLLFEEYFTVRFEPRIIKLLPGRFKEKWILQGVFLATCMMKMLQLRCMTITF